MPLVFFYDTISGVSVCGLFVEQISVRTHYTYIERTKRNFYHAIFFLIPYDIKHSIKNAHVIKKLLIRVSCVQKKTVYSALK